METLATILVCIALVLLEFVVAALIVAPKAIFRFVRGVVRRLWRGVAGRVGRAPGQARSSVTEQ